MRAFWMICAAALAFCGMASAQSGPETVRVHFDQAVMVGSVEIPAGDVTIEELSFAPDVMLLVRSKAGPQTTVMANRVTAPEGGDSHGASVVLTRTEAGYRLHRIWVTPVSGFELLQ